MNDFLSDDILQKTAQADMATLTELDTQGLFPAPDDSPQQFAQRLRLFRDKLHKLNQTLDTAGKADLKEYTDQDGATVLDSQRIPYAMFTHIAQRNKQLYRFAINWVPGFFMDYGCSLFGGCAFCSFPDFFTLFMVRDSFKDSEKWLIYNRNELIAHELCHVARISLGSEIFEETFAYQTADSGFRRLMGGIFYQQLDSLLFLGTTFLLLIAQFARTFAMPKLPLWPFWSLILIDLLWLLLRHANHTRTLQRARKSLQQLVGADHAWAVLFRMTDDEIREISQLSPAAIRSWIFQQTSLRWSIIKTRFPLLPERA